MNTQLTNDERELIKIQANKDSIYLDNIGRAKKEKHNRGIIDEASAMILNYLREHAKNISNGIGLSRNSFTNSETGEYKEQM